MTQGWRSCVGLENERGRGGCALLLTAGLLTDRPPAPGSTDNSADSVRGPRLAVVIPTLNERANVAILVRKLRDALSGYDWEAIFVDEDSTDGTMDAVRALARSDPRIRGIRRVGRRGLSGAAIEGILSTSAEFVAVMDADLQHDETCLLPMLARLEAGEADVVVASRYTEGGDAEGGLSRPRQLASRLATQLAKFACQTPLSDPMSGFFMLKREIVEGVARKLSPKGFKILLDVLSSSDRPLRVHEVAMAMRPRLHGDSKLDMRVTFEYLALVASKWSGGLLSERFLMFGLVGSTGLVVHLALLRTLLLLHIGFPVAQSAGMVGAMTSNYLLNNAFTYRDRRQKGWRLLTGLLSFYALCSIGAVAGVALSTQLYQQTNSNWWLAGIAGAAIAAIWNFATTAALTWRV